MNEIEKFNLKLIGKNQEDLKIISAFLQDSVVAVKDMVFLKKNKTFVMVVSRFMWEQFLENDYKSRKRIRSAVKFEEVISVEARNINQKNKNKKFECLAIESSLNTNEIFKIKILFAGNSAITINVEAIDLILQDLSKSWVIKNIPRHNI